MRFNLGKLLPVMGAVLAGGCASQPASSLDIDRAYETGASLFPPAARNPRVQFAQFNVIAIGSPTQRHRIADLTQRVIEASSREPRHKPSLGLLAARSCASTAIKVAG